MIGSTSKWSRAGLLAASILAVLPLLQAGAAERVGQIHERGTRTRALVEDPARSVLTAGASSRVCESGAKWLRLDFRSLKLRGYDSLVLRSSEGDRQVFQGAQWNNRSFTSRALRGSCVDIQPYFGDRESSYRLSSVTSGMRALSQTSVVVAGAGDLCDDTLTCKATSDLIVNINPEAVFTAGDNAYEDGTLSQYRSYYDQPDSQGNPTSWGRFKGKTKPTAGNHDYYISTNQGTGYFDYYNGVGNSEGLAGKRGEGYYSWDVGDWRFIALNTMKGATISPTGAQVTWLKQTLAANPKPCTAAYFHHPLISVGSYHNRGGGGYAYKEVKPLYDALYEAGVDLVLVGHDHNYQRYVKMNPNLQADPKGFVQVLVGTGGRNFYDIPDANRSNALLAKRPNSTDPAVSASTYGVLKLTLSSTGYTGEFVRATNSGNGNFGSSTRPENFSGTCNKASTGTTYAISGAVTTAAGAAIPGVSISNGSTTVTTNASGQYSFTGLASGRSYTLTPSLSGYTFSPVSQSVPVNGANVTGRNFTGTASSVSTQLLLNPGFESGNASWTATSGVIDGSTNALPRTGTWVAWLRDYGRAGTDTLTQSVSIPAGRTSAMLSFWLRISTAETTTTLQNDTMRVQVLDTADVVLKTCATYSNLTTPYRQYVQRSCDLTQYIGRTVRIRFTATENGSLRTGFRVDDTAVSVN
jgi:hypothetical protein